MQSDNGPVVDPKAGLWCGIATVQEREVGPGQRQTSSPEAEQRMEHGSRLMPPEMRLRKEFREQVAGYDGEATIRRTAIETGRLGRLKLKNRRG
jgi:hypothetical protein